MFKELKVNIVADLQSIRNSEDGKAVATKIFLRKLDVANVVIGYPDWVNSNTTKTFYSIKVRNNLLSDEFPA